jgi:hypothetical protein
MNTLSQTIPSLPYVLSDLNTRRYLKDDDPTSLLTTSATASINITIQGHLSNETPPPCGSNGKRKGKSRAQPSDTDDNGSIREHPGKTERLGLR